MAESIEYVRADPSASFSLATVVKAPGTWVQVAGSVGLGAEGTVVSGGIAAETEAVFDYIEGVLAKVGAGLSDIVSMGVFMTSLADDYAAFAAVRARRFGAEPPASTAVGVAGLLLGAHIEINAVAFLPE